MKNKKRLVPWLIAAVIIAALAVIGKKLYDLMFGGSLAVTTEDLKNGIRLFNNNRLSCALSKA